MNWSRPAFRSKRGRRQAAANLLGEEGRGFYLMMQGIENERLSIGA